MGGGRREAATWQTGGAGPQRLLVRSSPTEAGGRAVGSGGRGSGEVGGSGGDLEPILPPRLEGVRAPHLWARGKGGTGPTGAPSATSVMTGPGTATPPPCYLSPLAKPPPSPPTRRHHTVTTAAVYDRPTMTPDAGALVMTTGQLPPHQLCYPQGHPAPPALWLALCSADDGRGSDGGRPGSALRQGPKS